MNRDVSVKACRKPHVCAWCSEVVEVGQPAIKFANIFQGDFCHGHMHPECMKAHYFNHKFDPYYEGEFDGEAARGRIDQKHEIAPLTQEEMDDMLQKQNDAKQYEYLNRKWGN